MSTAGRLVYSAHDYPASVYAQTYFSDPTYPNNLPAVWDRNWGYLFRTGVAPVLLGEFGSNLATASDRAWYSKMVDYLKAPPPYVEHVMRFGQGCQQVQTLTRSDQIWRSWRSEGARWLFVLADLPDIYEAKEAGKDPRRLILPLDEKWWPFGASKLGIELRRAGVTLVYPRLLTNPN